MHELLGALAALYINVTAGQRHATGATTTTTTLPPSYAALPDCTGSVGWYYRFEEAAASDAASNSGSFTGEDPPAVASPARDTVTFKEGTKAGSFDGTTQYFSCNTTTCNDLNAVSGGALTVMGWAYVNTDNTGNIAHKVNANKGFRATRNSSNDHLDCAFGDGSATPPIASSTNGTFPITTWEFFACVFDATQAGAEIRAYTNAGNLGTNTIASWVSSASNFRIAAQSGPSTMLPGRVDGLIIDTAAYGTDDQARVLNCDLNGALCMGDGSGGYFSCTVDADCHQGTNTTALCSAGKCIGRGVIAVGSMSASNKACL